MKSSILAACLALACACSSPPDPKPDLGGPPASFPGFPGLAHEDMVNAQAAFEPNHAGLFGIDLLSERAIVPVRLEVGLRGEGAENRVILLNPDQWGLTLYLQDGTALRSVDPEELAGAVSKKIAQKVRDQRFKPGFLEKQTTSGFVFFALEPKGEFKVDGREIGHVRSGFVRGNDLYHSLVSFRVTIDDELRPFFVGIKPQ